MTPCIYFAKKEIAFMNMSKYNNSYDLRKIQQCKYKFVSPHRFRVGGNNSFMLSIKHKKIYKSLDYFFFSKFNTKYLLNAPLFTIIPFDKLTRKDCLYPTNTEILTLQEKRSLSFLPFFTISHLNTIKVKNLLNRRIR